MKDCHEKKQKIRPVGSGLSPNGIGLTRNGMVNLALMDRVLEVDQKNKRVRVEAGIRVQQLVDGIKEYGLTLQNFASIREQQIGGIVQVHSLSLCVCMLKEDGGILDLFSYDMNSVLSVINLFESSSCFSVW